MKAIAALIVIAAAVIVGAGAAQSDMHAPFDKILDTYVREGQVYYRALKLERANLDRYVASLDIGASAQGRMSKPAQQAFWLNAYNALVLRTVIDGYPISGKAPAYPSNSVRQIPGAFERLKHRVAGESLTLDEIETTKILPFGDPRMLLALGRGALGSNRLRSEAFRGDTLETQLSEVVKECVTKEVCFRIDQPARTIEVSAIFGWHAAAFEKYLSGEATGPWANRTPLERAIATMLAPHLFAAERDFLRANSFQLKYRDFDWTLNDLTGSGVPSSGVPGTGVFSTDFANWGTGVGRRW